VSTRKPRSSPCASGSISTSPAIEVSRRRAIASGERPPVLAPVVLAVLAGADRAPPVLVLAVPGDGALDPLAEAHLRAPAQLQQALGAKRIAAVVAGTVGDVLDQRGVAPAELEDAAHDLDVGQLVRAADVVDLARLPPLQHDVDRRGAVLHVEPVADLHPVAVNGQRIA